MKVTIALHVVCISASLAWLSYDSERRRLRRNILKKTLTTVTYQPTGKGLELEDIAVKLSLRARKHAYKRTYLIGVYDYILQFLHIFLSLLWFDCRCCCYCCFSLPGSEQKFEFLARPSSWHLAKSSEHSFLKHAHTLIPVVCMYVCSCGSKLVQLQHNYLLASLVSF